MKTKIIMISNPNQSNLKKGMIGYIDGYVRGGDNIPYAIVISDNIIDYSPLYCLKPYYETQQSDNGIINANPFKCKFEFDIHNNIYKIQFNSIEEDVNKIEVNEYFALKDFQGICFKCIDKAFNSDGSYTIKAEGF